MIFDTKPHPQTELLLRKALGKLSSTDPVLGGLIRRIGPCHLPMKPRNHYFFALVEAILYQQLGMKAAAAIVGRFCSLYPGRRVPTPEDIWKTPESRLRSAGLSSQKISYLKGLSRQVLDRTLTFRNLSEWEDEEVIQRLTQVKGIGRWTAEMFLIFSLGRPDVFPMNDLGIRKSVQKAYGLRTLPSARTLERLGEKWKPYRSIAAWYLWASADGDGAK
ncbi:MAG: DNA-3-methyladenine glycosylase 2 family protein [Acidobacteria bacterium]|nr:DNA-3-methyladenine glycosylase 2 family protein [Acidobacteriota bacterium]